MYIKTEDNYTMMSNKEAARWINALIDTMREETSRNSVLPDPEYKDEVYEALELAVAMLSRDDLAIAKTYSNARNRTASNITDDICPMCGGIKRFGICQDCGTDM